MSTDPDLVAWAVDCAERARDRLADDSPDDPARAAITAARHRAASTTAGAEPGQVAVEAYLAARTAAEAGHLALATAIRSAAAAAASVDDPSAAVTAAALALEVFGLTSAPCEASSVTATERRHQWESLPQRLRAAVLGEEPPAAAPPACAIGG